MARLTKILNGILGLGMHRRTSVSSLPKSDARIWEVRAKFDKKPRTGDRSARR